jgi:hypothetical protein
MTALLLTILESFCWFILILTAIDAVILCCLVVARRSRP